MLWGMLVGGAGPALGALEFTPAGERRTPPVALMFLDAKPLGSPGRREPDPVRSAGLLCRSIHAGSPSIAWRMR